MKFDFLQGDFSNGELSPRAQGHVESEAYKSGLSRMANTAPTRTGSAASRAGLKHLLDGASNLPVQHLPIHDGPYGDFIVEVSPTGIRLLDKFGVQPINFPPASQFLQFTVQDGDFAFGDPRTRTVYLRSDALTGARNYYLSKGDGPRNANIGGNYLGTPLLTDDHWTLSGRIAGDGITISVVQVPSGAAAAFAVVPDANGNFSIDFPEAGGDDFYIRLTTAAGTTATMLWDINLIKNAAQTSWDTTAVIPPPTFNGVPVPPTQERVRHASFWAKGDFWVAFAGGPGNAYAGFALRWHFSLTTLLTTWTFGTLPCTANSLAQIRGANAVAVFQDRLWYGVNLANGKRSIRASLVGFGDQWGYGAQAGSTGAPSSNSIGDWLFQFVVEKEVIAGTAAPPGGAPQTDFLYHFPCDDPKAGLIVFVDNGPRNETNDYTAVGHEQDYEVGGPAPFLDQDYSPGGYVSFNAAPNPALPNVKGNINPAGSIVSIQRGALAVDPLDLDLASPAGQIAWLNVLRGLILGTTRNEKLFTQATALAIDPASGQSFDVQDESSLGSDPALPALDINDRVLFAQRGRRILRLAGINIASDGGLVSEDIGVAGEHLTKARIRSMCYLKSPVPRVVFAFDDGTGAVMTLVGKSVAFSRLTIPACFGGIYNVASLDGADDSELWVGAENGATLWAATFESDIETKEIQIPGAAPFGPTHLKYGNENPLPPIMDGWCRRPLVNQFGAQYISGLPGVLEGQNVYALASGQLLGPFLVVGGQVSLANGLDTTWVDAGGARHAQDIYVGVPFPEHRITSLPLEGGNPVGTSQNLTSRKPQLYVRFVDSYLPKVNGTRPAERGAADTTDMLPARVTEDRRVTEMGFQRGAVVDIIMDLPLRMEIAAFFGGAVMNNV